MPSAIVDLRSDTVTKPTAAMRRAMAEAEVGDDGAGEDPTVRQLEEVFAERVGKEAALFVPSGTMGNQLALRLVPRRATAVIAGRTQHVVAYEAGAAAVNASVQFALVDDEAGLTDLDAVADAVAGAAHHRMPASAIFAENTHMAAGGIPFDGAWLDALASFGLPIHLDGARLFNAEVATGEPAARLAAGATTVMCCLSKGLGAPIGSLLAGPADLIDEARAERRRLGGTMRQVGVIAAAGLVALTQHVERLAEDHARAALLAHVVAERWPGSIDPDAVRTNIVVFAHPDTDALLAHLAEQGVRAYTVAPGRVRLVTHLDVDDEGIARAAKALRTSPC